MITVCGSTCRMVSLYKFADVRVFHNLWDLVLPSAVDDSKCKSIFATLGIPSRFLMSMLHLQCLMQNRPAIPQAFGASHQKLRRGNIPPLMNSLWSYTMWFYYSTKMQSICSCWKHIPANENCGPIHFQLVFVFGCPVSKQETWNWWHLYCANGNANGVHHKYLIGHLANTPKWKTSMSNRLGEWFHPTI